MKLVAVYLDHPARHCEHKVCCQEMKKVQPSADYDRLTMVGHSVGADISMHFAKIYPDHIKEVVTLDNLRVPFMTDGRFKILSFRSKDPQFKTDPGVVPPKGSVRSLALRSYKLATSTPT